MKWFVYRHEFNSKKIEKFNIFDHWRFANDVKALKKKKLSKDEFAEKLKSELAYYFWSKCEYEVVVASFPPYIDSKERVRIDEEAQDFIYNYGRRLEITSVNLLSSSKIDIYGQVMMNWDVFVDYVFDGK